MVLAGERAPGPEENLWKNDSPEQASIHYIHHQWPWKFKKSIRLLLFPITLIRLWLICKREKCEQVVGVFPNEYYLSLALFVSWLTGARFYSYFHNTYLDNRSGVKLRYAKWLQPRVFDRSETVFVMSDGMKKIWDQMYPDESFVSLVHTFNEQVVEPVISDVIPDDFRIALMGNLNNSNREAMGRMKCILETFPKCKVVTYSGVPDQMFADLGLTGDRVTNTKAPYDEVVDRLREFDLLFLPHGFSGGLKPIEYETIFPTRTIPYLLSGIPIIAHMPPGAFLTDWIRENDCAELVDTPDAEAICNAVRRLKNDVARRAELVANANKAVQMFQAPEVADRFRTILNGAAV